MSRRERLGWWFWLVMLAALASLLGTYIEWKKCDGQLARGLFWWTCIERER